MLSARIQLMLSILRKKNKNNPCTDGMSITVSGLTSGPFDNTITVNWPDSGLATITLVENNKRGLW